MLGNGKASKRWILLRPAYVLTGMTQKRDTTDGVEEEGVKEKPSPSEGKRQWDPRGNGGNITCNKRPILMQ